MEFGTAGLRGPMRAGFDSMNDLVIVQTGQGLVKYVKECYPDDVDHKRGIVLSYDGRYNSKRYHHNCNKVIVLCSSHFQICRANSNNFHQRKHPRISLQQNDRNTICAILCTRKKCSSRRYGNSIT
jgi:Phosphoglucomutase/phosphomannomutase, alpha/beta/alpha domain I